MKRFCYRGQYHNNAVLDFIKGKQSHIEDLLRAGKLFTATVFHFDNHNLFVYYECVQEELSPPGAAARYRGLSVSLAR